MALSIGEVARRTGLTASAIRYYEKAKLLPPPPRRGKQRCYDEEILGRIAVVQLARDSGFSIAETRLFLSGFTSDTKPAERWRVLAARKIEELDALIARTARMKALLESNFRCGCKQLADCERAIQLKSCSAA